MLSENPTSFCVFCYRSNTVNKINREILIKRFAKFVGRFVLNGKQNKLSKTLEQLFVSEISTDNLLNCCEDCKIIVDSFCEDYHKLKCLEMQLEWKLDKLVRIIKLANLVPSRISVVNRVLDDILTVDKDGREKRYKSIKKFRKTLAKAGIQRQKNSQPRVLLTSSNGNNVSCLPNASKIKDKGVIQHEYITFDNGPFCEKFSIENDDDVDIADPLDFDPAAETPENPNEPLPHTKLELLTDETGEIIGPISNSSPASSLPIDNINWNTHPKNITTEQTLKIELGHPTTDATDTAKNSKDNPTTNISTEDPHPTEIEHKPSKQLIEQSQLENSKGSIDNVTIAQTSISTHKRYSLREKSLPKVEQVNVDKPASDQDDDDFNDNDLTSSSSDSDVDEPDETLNVNRRGLQTPNLKTQLERLKKRGHMMCSLHGCQVKFRTEESYKSHLKLHIIGNFNCHFCPIVKTNVVELCHHEYKIHSTNENLIKDKYNHFNNTNIKMHYWSCPRCPNKTFVNFSSYLSHFAFTHFGIGNQEPLETTQKEILEPEIINGATRFRCKFCKLPFKGKVKLRVHIRLIHRIESTHPNIDTKSESPKLVENFKCNFCDSTFEYAPDLAIHETEHAVSKLTTEKMSKQNAVKKSKCPRCPFLYTLQGVYIKHHLKVHLKLLSGDYPGACKLCSGPDVYIPNRETHFDIFHNANRLEDPTKVFKCGYDQCAAYFLKTSQLYRHTNFIHLTNNHKCDICDKVFKTRRKLIDHKKRHNKNYDEDPSLPLACDRDGCPKRFKSEGELELHQIFHSHTDRAKAKRINDSGEKDKHICGECGKICKSADLLTIHQKTVHCERSFVCQECGKAFKSKYNLTIHLEYHKGPDEWKWECKECGKKCADKQKLKYHMNTHSKEKPWICEFCGEKYAHRHNWRSHLKTKHGDEEGAQEDIKGKIIIGTLNLKRKGTKKGDCILAGVAVKEIG